MDVKKLYGEQVELAKKAILTDSFNSIKRIGGVDCSYIGGERIIAGIVILDYATMRPLYRTFEVLPLDFPYIPGLLAYREAPAMIAAVKRAKVKPDLLLVDGFGTNHPRRCGIATQIGIKRDMPTIGVGKSFLCGNVVGDEIYQGSEKVGTLIYSKGSKRPVYVSAGHKISSETATKVVSRSIVSGRLPEPSRLAHEYVTDLKTKILSK